MALAGSQMVPPRRPTINSGIDGAAVISPLFTVAPFGVPSSLPVAGAIIAIEPATGGAVITRATANADGRFTIKLLPGRYRIVPLSPYPGMRFPVGEPQIVVALAGRYTHVTAIYNSGIV